MELLNQNRSVCSGPIGRGGAGFSGSRQSALGFLPLIAPVPNIGDRSASLSTLGLGPIVGPREDPSGGSRSRPAGLSTLGLRLIIRQSCCRCSDNVCYPEQFRRHILRASFIARGPSRTSSALFYITKGYRTGRGPDYIGAPAMDVFPGTGSGFD
jgi:hypothetical protein